MSKESFKAFARNHPELLNTVESGNSTWQKLYEIYDIYGEESKIWNKYFSIGKNSTVATATKPLKDATIGDIVKTIKGVDLKNVQKGIANLQKTISMIEDLGLGGATESAAKATYEARPMYKYFED